MAESPVDDAAIVRRLKSIEGHIRGIEKMVEEDAYCIDIVTQTQAVQAALNKVNSMVLDNPGAKAGLQRKTQQFVQRIAEQQYPHPYLLLHMPLYRPNDLKCGPTRLKEGGHITYEAPEFNYTIHRHVSSEKASNTLLQHLRPSYVFSGHTHTLCSYEHHVDDRIIPEFTLPAFSWGMRPDPSFGLVTLKQGKVDIELCYLPQQDIVYAFYGIAGLILLWLMCRSPAKKERKEE